MTASILHQWRTQKIFMRGFIKVAYGGHLYLVCAVCDVTVWRHIHVSIRRGHSGDASPPTRPKERIVLLMVFIA